MPGQGNSTVNPQMAGFFGKPMTSQSGNAQAKPFTPLGPEFSSPYWYSGAAPSMGGIWGSPSGVGGSGSMFGAPPGLLSSPPPSVQMPAYVPPPMKTGVAALPPGTQLPPHVAQLLANKSPAAQSIGQRIVQQMAQRPGWQPRRPGGMGGNMGGWSAAPGPNLGTGPKGTAVGPNGEPLGM